MSTSSIQQECAFSPEGKKRDVYIAVNLMPRIYKKKGTIFNGILETLKTLLEGVKLDPLCLCRHADIHEAPCQKHVRGMRHKQYSEGTTVFAQEE